MAMRKVICNCQPRSELLAQTANLADRFHQFYNFRLKEVFNSIS